MPLPRKSLCTYSDSSAVLCMSIDQRPSMPRAEFNLLTLHMLVGHGSVGDWPTRRCASFPFLHPRVLRQGRGIAPP